MTPLNYGPRTPLNFNRKARINLCIQKTIQIKAWFTESAITCQQNLCSADFVNAENKKG